VVEERGLRPREELIPSLIFTETTEGRITTEELISTCILLLVVGHEMTVNRIDYRCSTGRGRHPLTGAVAAGKSTRLLRQSM